MKTAQELEKEGYRPVACVKKEVWEASDEEGRKALLNHCLCPRVLPDGSGGVEISEQAGHIIFFVKLIVQ